MLSDAAVASVGLRRERDEVQTRHWTLAAEIAEIRSSLANAVTDFRSAQASLAAACAIIFTVI